MFCHDNVATNVINGLRELDIKGNPTALGLTTDQELTLWKLIAEAASAEHTRNVLVAEGKIHDSADKRMRLPEGFKLKSSKEYFNDPYVSTAIDDTKKALASTEPTLNDPEGIPHEHAQPS